VVLVNNISEKERHSSGDVNRKMCPYVYLIDNDQKMMLIIKRDFSEMSGDSASDQKSAQHFVIRQIESLLARIDDQGPMSSRETEILKYAAMGKSNKQIAKILGRSECTIKNHISRIMKKLHANDRTHAVTLALCNGWLPGLSSKEGVHWG
jgi:DNA-binding NarL/FixJ family response regulator